MTPHQEAFCRYCDARSEVLKARVAGSLEDSGRLDRAYAALNAAEAELRKFDAQER